MSKALQAAKNFEDSGINATLLDQLDSPDFERYLGLPSQDNLFLRSKIDGTREWAQVDTSIEWGEIGGTLSNQTDLQNELNLKANKVDVFDKTEFISVSGGTPDSGKPIVLNSQGQIDPSMIDASTFYYVGAWDPSDASNPSEYPDTTGETYGAFWVVGALVNPDNPGAPTGDLEYTFQSGDLAGKVIGIGDFMVWGTGGWSIMRGEMNPLLYYKLDGSQAITGPFAGGGQQFKNAAEGTDNSDLVTLSQLNNQTHEIDDINGLPAELDGKVNVAGDTMTGSLAVQDNIFIDSDTTNYDLVFRDNAQEAQVTIGVGSNGSMVTSVYQGGSVVNQFQVGITDGSALVGNHQIWHAGNFDPSTKENNLGNPSVDGQILSSLTDGTRSWVDIPNSAVWGQITGTLSNQTDLQNALDAKANKSGDTFTGDVRFNYDIYVGSTGTGDSIINFWSESEGNTRYLMMDQNDGKLKTDAELYSSVFISSAGTVRTGYNNNNNSVYEFTDPSGPEIPTVFWHNIEKDFFVDTNTTLNLRLFHEGNANLIPISDDVQNALDDKENWLNNPSQDGMILTSTASGTRSWITPPQGVTEHNLLTGRDDADAHPIDSITGLQSELDSKSDVGHTHTDYVEKTGDVMTGSLTISSDSPVYVLKDADTKEGRISLFPTEMFIQTSKNDFIFSGIGGAEFNGEIYIKKSDGTHSLYHGGNDGAGSGLDADLLDGMQPNQLPISDDTQAALDGKAPLTHTHEISDVNNLQTELDSKMDDGDAYLKTEHIDATTGTGDAGKPVITNANGKLDMSFLDTSYFEYQGSFTPVTGDETTEYPTGDHQPGYFWDIQGVDDVAGFTWSVGDLSGETAYNGDKLFYGNTGWSISAGDGVDPTVYYRLDGAMAITERFNGGSQQFKFAADATDDTDLTTLGQVNTLLSSKVSKSGDTMTGDLEIDTLLTVHGGTTTGGNLDILNRDDPALGKSRMWYINGSINLQGLDETDTEISTELFVNGYRVWNENTFDPSTKADVVHSHVISDVDGLQAELDSKSDVGHNHDTLYAPISHTHEISDINGLQDALNAKENNLGNPSTDGQILSSQTDGTRSWIDIPSTVSAIRERFIGDGTTDTFTLTNPCTPDNADVYYNGVKLSNGIDVDVSSGTEIVFTEAPGVDDIIEVVGFNMPVTVTVPTP